LNSAAFNGARILGPLMAGFVIANFSIPACFFLNALSFVPVVFALTRIGAAGTTKISQKGFIDTIREGAQFVAREKSILYIMYVISVFSLFGIPYLTLLPVLADEVFKEGVRGLSFLVSSAGLGSFAAAMIIAFKGEISGKCTYIRCSAVIFSLALMAITLFDNFHIAMLLIFFAGWGIVSFLAVCNSFIQQVVPDALRGRVMSLYTLVFLGFAPLGNSAIGFAAHSFGTLLSLRIFAAICIFSSVIFYVLFGKSYKERIE